jgi:predicted CXXCH cytochrome family protein
MVRALIPVFLIVAAASVLAAQENKAESKAEQKADKAPAPEAKAVQTKPADTNPAAKPVEAKPVETKPPEAKPAETKPAAIEIKFVPDAENSCIQCHTSPDMWDPKDLKTMKALGKFPLEVFKNDIHWQRGVRCQDCHGGDTTVMEVKAHQAHGEFRTIKSPADVPAFCGRCHSDGEYMRHFVPSPRTDELSEYWTSGHGKHLKATGDPQVATCISCHDYPHGNALDTKLHGIRPVAEPSSPVYHTNVPLTCAKCHSDKTIMAGRTYKGKPLGCDEYANWRKSVHGVALIDKGDFSAPACNNCHGNHGAAPPQMDSVANACGSCHGKIAKLFADTKMRHSFEKEGLPGCATCHSNHFIHTPTDEFLGMQEGAFCARCHEEGKLKHGATIAGTQAAKRLHDDLGHLKTGITTAEETLANAAELGMEVSKPKFELRKASDALTNARTMIHSFNVDTVEKALSVGEKVVAEAQEKGDEALRQYQERRVWLGVSLIPIFVVIGLLLAYIRSMSAPPQDA